MEFWTFVFACVLVSAIAKLIKNALDHDRDTRIAKVEADLKLLRQMAAVDGTIEPREQQLFDQICEVLGVAKETLTLDV